MILAWVIFALHINPPAVCEQAIHHLSALKITVTETLGIRVPPKEHNALQIPEEMYAFP
jgi:hypothetical protein